MQKAKFIGVPAACECIRASTTHHNILIYNTISEIDMSNTKRIISPKLKHKIDRYVNIDNVALFAKTIENPRQSRTTWTKILFSLKYRTHDSQLGRKGVISLGYLKRSLFVS